MKMKMKMFVMLAKLLYVSQHALGVEIKVYQGTESVLLPCQGNVSASNTVVWSREELVLKIVHKYQQSGDDLKNQNQDYRDRTSMRTDALQTGDLSLTLRRPTIRDSSTYTCTIREGFNTKSQEEVELTVTEPPPPPPVWPWVLAGVLSVTAVAAAAAGFFMYKRKKDREVKQVKEGEESVQLPFKTTPHLSGDVRVEWMDHHYNKVHVYQNGSDRPEEQDQVYRDRTEMKKDPLRTGDLSLTLKHPTVRDTGYYTCRVSKDGDLLGGTAVFLCVKGRNQDIRNRSNNAESTRMMDVPAV
ncbi:uncharacterized protein LOC111659183 [Seriola lalandi dorsalis]|uniref:uncharacterized protein LOC111659183 n=1 Tax=Seriola lalandi dorsalis TaxID=1841481 RepID=UPI000C6F9968|nr:uncharacterized protein LOC111659183 [Seriola lalandi dorsalis]